MRKWRSLRWPFFQTSSRSWPLHWNGCLQSHFWRGRQEIRKDKNKTWFIMSHYWMYYLTSCHDVDMDRMNTKANNWFKILLTLFKIGIACFFTTILYRRQNWMEGLTRFLDIGRSHLRFEDMILWSFWSGSQQMKKVYLFEWFSVKNQLFILLIEVVKEGCSNSKYSTIHRCTIFGYFYSSNDNLFIFSLLHFQAFRIWKAMNPSSPAVSENPPEAESQPPPPTTPPASTPTTSQCTSKAATTWQCHHSNLNFSQDFSHLYGGSASVATSSPHPHSTTLTSHQEQQLSPPPADSGAACGAPHRQLAPSVQIWYCVHFMRLCQICLAMPLVGLVACLLMAVIFQFGDIQETACKVREANNYICFVFSRSLDENTSSRTITAVKQLELSQFFFWFGGTLGVSLKGRISRLPEQPCWLYA